MPTVVEVDGYCCPECWHGWEYAEEFESDDLARQWINEQAAKGDKAKYRIREEAE